ncbi:LPXTG cell wall anchor domain-containing protein [Lentzea flaviverrucosa]|uniref:LPXTG-motif cell wall anchor domain-containing protein n=1 Tax=Lentzea flaviverrucosa TaxID=200379 RepID=A0A1H9W818_9PSEU|nr:LPXTG cell wall anchor domain-containing protein [Lentzea flaviverrucosa]RDI22315.1 LPXTG-motif cell wall-anchored protein [Lentzea flaviverrucosa]SES29974.1 LPXTG-motif cell wall anchor domain-containing protein [Lentzea flaviverrucosa]
MARRVLGAFAVTATAALATLALTGTAQAHTPVVNKGCDEKTQKSWFTLSLKDYGTAKDNTVVVKIDGVEAFKTTFKGKLDEQKWERDGNADHTYEATITAYDDPNFQKGWSKVETRTTKDCVKTPPTTTTKQTTTTTTTPVATSPEVPSSSEVPPTSTTPVAPGGSAPEPPLAATGASPLWLLLSGLGLVGAGAGTLLFLRRRRSA